MERGSRHKKMARNQSSFYEQAIYYYVLQFFPKAINRFKFDNGAEADICIHDIKCVIEYDGFYWHKERIDKDNYKNVFFNSIDYFVIRVRDTGLPDLDEFNGITLYHKALSSDNRAYHIDEIIEQIIHLLGSLQDDEKERNKLNSFSLPHEEFLLHCPDINATLYPCPVYPSLADCYGIEKWDYEKNGRLNPANLPWDYAQKAFFKCRAGKSLYSYHAIWLSKEPFDSIKDYRIVCPCLIQCAENCSFKNDLIPLYLDGMVQMNDKELSFFRNVYGDSDCTKTCLKKRFCDNPSMDLINRFNRFFIVNHKDYDEFIAKHMTWLSCEQDIDLIKNLYNEYSIRIINIEALGFDETESQRKAFIDYYQWLIARFKRRGLNPIAIGMSFFNGIKSGMTLHKITIDFARELLAFIILNPEIFRNEFNSINQLEQYISAYPKNVD